VKRPFFERTFSHLSDVSVALSAVSSSTISSETISFGGQNASNRIDTSQLASRSSSVSTVLPDQQVLGNDSAHFES
jgi:hypothetical protein